MANKFGFNQLLSEIPAAIRRFRDAATYVISGSLISAPLLANKLDMTVDDYSMWCGLIILGIGGFCMFFGIPPKEGDTFKMSAPKDDEIKNS